MKYKTQRDEGRGYWSLIGLGGFGEVAYILLPEGHPDIEEALDYFSKRE